MTPSAMRTAQEYALHALWYGSISSLHPFEVEKRSPQALIVAMVAGSFCESVGRQRSVSQHMNVGFPGPRMPR